jgi:hypothetical protein
MEINDFDEIRPYNDEELPQVYEELIADQAFRHVVEIMMPGIPFDAIAQRMRGCKTKLDFQKAFCYPLLTDIMRKHTDGVDITISDSNDPAKAYTYISNHRDIVLDSGLLSILLVDHGRDTVEIAIGDNLLIYPWIKRLVRINKSFIVKRGLPMRQMLEASERMSRYMHYTIAIKNQSIWIAQREGRAKDSNDRTQDSVLKMIAIGGEGDIVERIKEMNIAPLAISYEFDPCDYLKASEFQLKRDVEGYKKSMEDDLLNMQTGILGYKGRVHFHVAPSINKEIDKLDRSMNKQEMYASISAIIDREIHSNYRIYPCNMIANDMLNGSHDFAAHYTDDDLKRFESYIEGQLAKINIENPDRPFLREVMLKMYANPLKNYMAAGGTLE